MAVEFKDEVLKACVAKRAELLAGRMTVEKKRLLDECFATFAARVAEMERAALLLYERRECDRERAKRARRAKKKGQ